MRGGGGKPERAGGVGGVRGEGVGAVGRGGGASSAARDDKQGLQERSDGGDRPRNTGTVIKPGSTYEDLLSTSRPFPQPIPLPEMVRFLIQVWEQEGLYD
ncbi:hypothetical protein CLOM_g19766 [Closterium sp. NIES-68]|nr:hypothetical protein CLOM_g19766 [Closterium sp. NIES-68]GJP77878.1 hypothetical protein CLOP_g8211 [Closterium sp. NIES-67]